MIHKRKMIDNILKNGVVHFSNNVSLIKSSGRQIIIYRRKSKLKIKINLPFRFPRDFHFNIPLLKRLLRSDYKEIIYDEQNEKLVVVRDSFIYLIKESSYMILGEIKGDAPLFNSHCIQNGIIYFGQYDQNKKRESSRIYKIDKENKLSIAYTFLPGEIRHVHSITLDPYIKNRIWVTTGDNNGECLLLFTDDNFNNISNIGDKSQDFRIVNLGFSKDYLFYGTDNLIKENYIYRQNRLDGKREQVLSIKQTAWFLKQDKKGNVILGTTVENGRGCQVDYSSIYYSRDFGMNWIELLRIPKDIYPMPLFKWGSVSFSNGAENLYDTFINVESLKYLSGKSFSLDYIINFSEKDLRAIEVKKKVYFKSNSHLMLTIYRLFSLYQNSKDLRYLNLLLKLIDWMPMYTIYQKNELRKKALNIYESFDNRSN